MPIPLLAQVVFVGIPGGISYLTALKAIAVIVILAAIKWYFNGVSNASERKMHSKVVMITVCLLALLNTITGH